MNPYSYQGASSPSNAFANESDYNAALIAKCHELSIELIAVTDHWAIDGSTELLAAAEKAGIAALPGFEANSSEGVHLLVLFESGTPASEINACIGACGVAPNCANGTPGHPLKNVAEEMTRRGALVIPAHANVANSGMLTGRGGVPLVQMVINPNLHVIGLSPSQPAAPDQEAILRNSPPFKRDHPMIEVHADDVSSPAALERLGATSWFKMSTPCLTSLKHAVRIPKTRVSLTDPSAAARPVIRGIAWSGGFLRGVDVDLSEDLTSFIGGRGTGKSTAIESLRYALELEPLGPNAKVDHKAVVSDVLKSGTTIRVTVDAVHPDLATYTIERTVPNPAVVVDASGAATNLRPQDITGPVEIFGQHELAELAQDKGSVAKMLERFSGANAGTQKRSQVAARLAENRHKLDAAEDSRELLEGELADLPRLQDQVDIFAKSDLAKKLANKQRLQQDQAVFAEVSDRLTEASRLLDEMELDPTLTTLKAPIDVIAGSSQEAFLRDAEGVGRRVADSISGAISDLRREIADGQAALESSQLEWGKATASQQAEHDEVIRQLVEDGHEPEKYLETTAALDALKTKAQRRSSSDSLLSSLRKERRDLLGELALADGESARTLVDAVRAANDSTSRAVNVRPIPAVDRSAIKKVFTDLVPGQRTLIMAAVDKDDFSTAAFVAVARKGPADLEAQYGIRGAQLNSVVAAGEKLYRRLEELTVGQAVDVYLDTTIDTGTQTFRRLDQLSKGQKATALLLLLLGASDAPLVIDQPEDDLDNRFVFHEIVTKLQDLKGQRQVVVTTHNANVPVLGDAELIITLEGDGQTAWPVTDGVGSLDNPAIRTLAEDLLEGGKDAFEARQHLYDF